MSSGSDTALMPVTRPISTALAASHGPRRRSPASSTTNAASSATENQVVARKAGAIWVNSTSALTASAMAAVVAAAQRPASQYAASASRAMPSRVSAYGMAPHTQRWAGSHSVARKASSVLSDETSPSTVAPPT